MMGELQDMVRMIILAFLGDLASKKRRWAQAKTKQK
jgi:hypothetical protein